MLRKRIKLMKLTVHAGRSRGTRDFLFSSDLRGKVASITIRPHHTLNILLADMPSLYLFYSQIIPSPKIFSPRLWQSTVLCECHGKLMDPFNDETSRFVIWYSFTFTHHVRRHLKLVESIQSASVLRIPSPSPHYESADIAFVYLMNPKPQELLGGCSGK